LPPPFLTGEETVKIIVLSLALYVLCHMYLNILCVHIYAAPHMLTHQRQIGR